MNEKKTTKPGWKTSEFWITLVVLLAAALTSSGAIGPDSGVGHVLALVVAAGTALGYGAMRSFTKVKAGEAKSAAPGMDAEGLGKLLKSIGVPAANEPKKEN